MAINAGETIRLSARPFQWDGEIDNNATVTFTTTKKDEDTSDSQALVWNSGIQAFFKDFILSESGVYKIHIKAVLDDNSVSKETRQVEVKS